MTGAEQALHDYLSAAVQGDRRGMVRATQRSYPAKNRHHTLRAHLVKFVVGTEKPIGLPGREYSEVMRDVSARLWTRGEDGKPNYMGEFRFRVICEDRTGSPDPEGRWGVNPISLRLVKEKTDAA